MSVNRGYRTQQLTIYLSTVLGEEPIHTQAFESLIQVWLSVGIPGRWEALSNHLNAIVRTRDQPC